MNGPEHYQEAERLLAATVGEPQSTLAAAQVHATLALAAATFDTGYSMAVTHIPNMDAWTETLK